MMQRDGRACVLFLLLLVVVAAAVIVPQAHAYKQTVDVLLSNGHKVTVQFADDFPDSALSANIAYVQRDIPKIAELFYMPDHDFSLTYDTSYDPNGCSPPGAAAGYREFCVRADIFTLFDSLTVEGIVIHELTHVFQFETDIGSLSLEGSATAVEMIITHGLGYGQLLGGDVDYTAITPDNGPAIYLESQIALQYFLSNPLEKLYAYRPTIFREWTSQPSSDSYAKILGNAVLDSKPLAQWLRDQGLEASNLQDGIYAATYATLRNNLFYARVETYQQTNGNATVVTPQSVTCTLYTPAGQYITSAQAQIQSDASAFCSITDTSITADTEQVRADIHVDAVGRTLDRHVLAFKYLDIDPSSGQITASYNRVALVGNDQLPIITTGTATINLQTIAGGTQTLQASIINGAFKWPIGDTYGLANIDITTPTFQYHIQSFPFTYRPRGLTVATSTAATTTSTATSTPTLTASSTTTIATTATGAKYQLTVNVVGGPSEAVSVLLNPQTSDSQYDQGAAVQASSVIHTSGYSFDHWELDGVNVGSTQPYLIIMNTSHTLTAVFTAPQITTTTRQSTPASPSRCIIATAAYGSEMAPDVVYMRYVRDGLIGSTPIGHPIVQVWNAFYYSWSPPVAAAIAESSLLQAIFRILLLPLVAIVHITAWIFAALGSENLASAVAFIVAAVLSTCTYIVLPALVLRRVLTLRIQRNRRQTPNCCGGRS
jgi:hypothetical protein